MGFLWVGRLARLKGCKLNGQQLMRNRQSAMVAIVRVIWGLCLILTLLLVSGEAQAGQLANRLAQFPHWDSKPPVASATGDLVYPDWMAGTWEVTSTLVEQVAPLAPEIVTPGFESNRSYLNQPISFLVRFQNQQPLSVISSQFLPFTGKDFQFNSSGVVADREFNGLNIGKAYLGDRTIVSVKVDPHDPNRQVTSLRNGNQLISIVTGRAAETPNSEEFIATEVSQQIFRGSSQPYLNQVETTTAYKLLQSPSLAIEADQITAVYLSPKDADYFQALEKPVALYRYRLELLPIES